MSIPLRFIERAVTRKVCTKIFIVTFDSMLKRIFLPKRISVRQNVSCENPNPSSSLCHRALSRRGSGNFVQESITARERAHFRARARAEKTRASLPAWLFDESARSIRGSLINVFIGKNLHAHLYRKEIQKPLLLPTTLGFSFFFSLHLQRGV